MDSRTICLAILSRGDASGYEIRKAVEEGPFSQIQEIGFGSIYPALERIQKGGLAAVTKVPQDGRPAKKVYSITPAGRMALMDALGEPSEPDRVRSDFLFRMMFADLLSARTLEQFVEERMAYLETMIERLGACDVQQDPGAKFVSGFGLAIYKTMAKYIEEHRTEMIGTALLAERPAAE
ncbi:MAG: PadR family transcriptional regulator [Alphaproteobacteria bacterium]